MSEISIVIKSRKLENLENKYLLVRAHANNDEEAGQQDYLFLKNVLELFPESLRFHRNDYEREQLIVVTARHPTKDIIYWKWVIDLRKQKSPLSVDGILKEIENAAKELNLQL